MIEIPVSMGELFDKITILEIKQNHMINAQQLNNVTTELNYLREKSHDLNTSQIKDTIQQLRTTNEQLWCLENKIRLLEKQNKLDDEYIGVSIDIRRLNDYRAQLKRNINLSMNSHIIEEKQHS